MQRNQLGDTDLHVSKVCLGTMTFGEQNSEGDAHSPYLDIFRRAQTCRRSVHIVSAATPELR